MTIKSMRKQSKLTLSPLDKKKTPRLTKDLQRTTLSFPIYLKTLLDLFEDGSLDEQDLIQQVQNIILEKTKRPPVLEKRQRPPISTKKLELLDEWFHTNITIKENALGALISELFTNYSNYLEKKGLGEKERISKKAFGQSLSFLLKSIKKYPFVEYHSTRQSYFTGIEFAEKNH